MSGNGDYILRQDALDVMCEILCDDRENCDENTYCCSANLMKRIPAADVRPVVFCGDCTKYFGKEDGGYTAGYCKRTYISVGPFDFCSRGEKRGESDV